MKIKYLKKLSRARRINSRKNVGMTMDQITALESNAPGTFPKAYKELLFIAGKESGLFSEGWSFGVWDEALEGGNNVLEQQELAREILTDKQFSLEGDYWVIADLDNCEQFYYFKFDNPSGDNDDPPVYICDVGYWEDGEVEPGHKFSKKIADSFSEFVENWMKYSNAL